MSYVLDVAGRAGTAFSVLPSGFMFATGDDIFRLKNSMFTDNSFLVNWGSLCEWGVKLLKLFDQYDDTSTEPYDSRQFMTLFHSLYI